LTDKDQKQPANPTGGASESGRLPGHLELDFPQADNAGEQGTQQPKRLSERLKNDCQKPRFWLEILGLLLIAYYAYQAAVANGLTRKALAVSTRPYIGVAFLDNDLYYVPVFRPSRFTDMRNIQIQITYINFGKLPADALIRRVIVPSEKQLPGGPDTEGVTPIHQVLWPPPVSNPDMATLSKDLTDNQLAEMNAGKYRWLYLRVQVEYGPYHTNFCKEWKILVGSTNSSGVNKPVPMMTQPTLCEDRASNSAD